MLAQNNLYRLFSDTYLFLTTIRKWMGKNGGNEARTPLKRYISIFQCSHSATFHSRHNLIIFRIINDLQMFYFYTHPLFAYHTSFFHYLFSNFADE